MKGNKWIALAIVIAVCATTCIVSTRVHASNQKALDSVNKVNEYDSEIDLEEGNKYSTDEISNGAILQAWCWSFNTIRENLPLIKKAGFSAVQTSPIQECRVGDNNNNYSMDLRNWYYTYQPVDFVVGNYQLGTKEELKTLCDEAKKYDIKVIADVVINHMSSEWNYIKPNMQNYDYFNTNWGISNWEDRYCITNMALSGLWDLKTSSKSVQNIIRNFLVDCVDLGISGFRYDCAKHIELPEDEGFGSDFWPYITNNGAEIQVGEVLKGSTARYDKYAKYLNVTAAEYGEVMQEALRYRDFSVGKLLDYRVGVDSSRVVTWVESHDNFANDEMDSVWMTDEDLKLGWAAITARANTTTFMFNRPLGAGGTDYDSRFPGLSQIGDKGSDLFMDDEIVEVNLFRNEMEDESEYLRNLRTNKVLMIERGNRGAVIINVGDSNVSVEDKTNLYDGRYVNRTDEKNVFSIENGIIKGIVPARSVVVIYKSKLEISGEYIDIKGYDEEVENYFTDKGHKVVLLKSDNVNAYYSINGVDKGMYFNGQKVDISDMCEYNGTVEIKLKAEDERGNIEVKTYYFTKKKAINVHRIRLKKNKELKSPVYCYMYSAYGEVSMWPGIEMRDCGDDVYEITVLKDPFNPPEYVIFNDTSKQVPSKNEYGFKYINNATYSINGDVKPIDN